MRGLFSGVPPTQSETLIQGVLKVKFTKVNICCALRYTIIFNADFLHLNVLVCLIGYFTRNTPFLVGFAASIIEGDLLSKLGEYFPIISAYQR